MDLDYFGVKNRAAKNFVYETLYLKLIHYGTVAKSRIEIHSNI